MGAHALGGGGVSHVALLMSHVAEGRICMAGAQARRPRPGTRAQSGSEGADAYRSVFSYFFFIQGIGVRFYAVMIEFIVRDTFGF